MVVLQPLELVVASRAIIPALTGCVSSICEAKLVLDDHAEAGGMWGRLIARG
jgi:hypothetical protein